MRERHLTGEGRQKNTPDTGIYPDEFYQKIIDRDLCVSGQNVLDLGTGTGVLPRNMYHYGAKWTGTDSSPEQIREEELGCGAQKAP